MGHHSGKPPVPLTRPVTVIGSRSSARIHLISSTVSKAHALLVKSNDGVYIRDLASRSRVYINGDQVREADLQDGDLIKIGSFTFKFVAGPPSRVAERTAPPAELDVTGGQFPIPIDQRVLLIGRRSADDIVLVEESASTAHAVVFEMDGERYVRDLGSRTGTFVNGVSTHQHKLSPGDLVRIGETDIRYNTVSAPASIELASDSATGYALEAPQDEIELAPGEQQDEHETIGGLDLMGQIVKDEMARDAAPPRPEQKTAEPRVPAAAAPSADIEDLQDELLGTAPAAEESSSVAEAAADSMPRASDATAEAATGPADAGLQPRRGWRSSLGDEAEPVETAPKEPTSEVLRFPEPSSPLDDRADELDGGTAVLDQDALAPALPDEQAFDVADSLAPVVEVEPRELKLNFTEPWSPPTEAAPPAEPVNLSDIDLAIREEPAAEIDLRLEPSHDATPSPALDFLVNESPEPVTPLLDLDKLAAPPLKLSLEAEALADATQKLTKRTRKSKKKVDVEPDLSEGIEPFTPLPLAEAPDPFTAATHQIEKFDPFAGIDTLPAAELPPIENIPEDQSRLDLPPPGEDVEVLDQTKPEPDFAIDLDEATDAVALDDSAIARALVEPSGDELTDTKFTRAVEEFTGDSTGEIVERGAYGDVAPAPPVLPETSAASAIELPVLAPLPAEDLTVAQPRAEAPLPPPSEPTFPREPDSAAAPRPVAPTSVDPFLVGGANRENFLGGAPLPRAAPPKPPTRKVPLKRDPVEELIAEIDSAAAAAERAETDVPRRSAPEMDMPVDPFAVGQTPRGPRSGPVTRRAPGSGNLDETIPPFAGADETSAPATCGFDGLAMPPVRQADVFSTMSPPGAEPRPADSSAEITHDPQDERFARRGRPMTGAFKVPEDAFFGGGASGGSAGDPAVALHEDLPARRPVRPALADSAVLGGRPAVVYADEDEIEFDDTELKRRTSRRVLTLVLIGLALIAAAVGGVYGFLPVESRLEASIRYANLDRRTQRDREEIQKDQIRRLRADYLREAAKKKLLLTPEVSPGFLDDTVRYSRVVDRAHWPEPRNGQVVLVLTSEGSNRQAEATRLRAMAAALYGDNTDTLINPARAARNAVQRLKDDVAKAERRRDELNGEIASQRILYERKPSLEQVKVLEEKLGRLEEAWKRALSSVKDAEAELDRIKSGAAPGANGKDLPLPDDEELTNMRRELAQLQARVQAASDDSDEKARVARQRLDDAMSAFQQEIATARDAMSNNPELAAYIAAAQQLQDATSQLIDDLIRRQEQQFNSLMELKARLNEKMEARRGEMWQADKELQDLTERLAILTRQFNAAIGGGLKTEAEDLKAQIDLTKNMLRARQDLIPADPGYAEAIQQLELFISSTQKNINEDRARTDGLLAKLQRGFTSSPQMEKLPAEQKELARRLVTKLESINDARTAYNASLDAGATAGDAQLQQQIAAIQAGISARTKQLADQRAADLAAGQDPVLVKEKQAQLDTLKAQARKAEEEYFAVREELDGARRAVADARSSYDKLEKLESERNDLQTLLKTQNDTLVEKQRALNAAVEPLPLGENDIRITEGADRRPTFAAIAAGSLAVVFGGLVLLTLSRASREDGRPLVPADLRPIPHPTPQPTSHGNRQPGADNNGSGGEDDHQPAVI